MTDRIFAGRSQAADQPGSADPFDLANLTRSEVVTALAHLYRGELARSNTWRSRLDATTNWAVVTTGIALSYAFGGAQNTPVVILNVNLLVLLFLFIEARRYRYYELWTHRVRMLETNFYSGILSPSHRRSEDWNLRLIESLQHPRFPIGLLEALGRRYRRTYALLILILALSWVVKLVIHPTPVATWSEFLGRAAIGHAPGWIVLAIGVALNGALVALGLFTVGLRQSDAEVLAEAPRSYFRLLARLRAATREALEIDLGVLNPIARRGSRKQMVFIVSDAVEAVSRPLLEKLDRGVTLIRGLGMYSGKEHGILLCVVESRQMDELRGMVREQDPNAFVVVTGASDVRGEGFRPLEA